ncbi:MAG: hypothetical protein NT084_05060 [Bacteroidetes bacterium]|nr:hypothetical protein [Bacteroidota bacterium]
MLLFSFIACQHEKVCSGLNPETGKYNSYSKVRKGKRTAHGNPEKQAIRRRQKSIRKQKGWNLSKTTGKPTGVFQFGGSVHGGGSSSGGANVSQPKN